MARQRRGTWAVAAGSALVIVLAGCSGGGGDEPDGGDATLGPLGKYFEQIGGSYDQEDAEAQARRAEEVVAECMAEEGFEYTPMDTTQGIVVAESTDDSGIPAWDSVEYAQLYGYGATTWEDMPGVSGPAQEWVDPNQDYVEAMSDSERDAYYEALYGPPMLDPGIDDEDGYEYDWTTAGCQGRAQHEVYEEGQENQPWDDEAFKALEEDLMALYEGMSDDPRLADVDVEWSDCMADAGYDLDDPTAAQQSIYDELNALYEESGSEGVEPGEAAMAELREQEIATAVADRTCQNEVRYTQRQQEVMSDLEQQFVDAHKAELDAWVAKYADED